MDVNIKLKSGLKWSDGQPLTPKDLSLTINAICDPATGAASPLGDSSVAAVEDKSDTVEVWHFGPDTTGKRYGNSSPLTSGIYASFIAAMGFTPVPSHVLTSVQHAEWATNSYFTTNPTATSGPYMVQNFTPAPVAQVVMIPTPNYPNGRSGARSSAHTPYSAN